jgi:hypothetical protein
MLQYLHELIKRRSDLPQANFPIVVEPDGFDDGAGAPPDVEQERIDLEDIYCAIEYVDAAGNWSRRRVNFRYAYQQRHNWIFQAICHERKSIRAFRADRIKCVIDIAGEIHSAQEFFRPFGVPIHVFEPTSGRAGDESQSKPERNKISSQAAGALQRSIVRDEVRILAALSRTDGRLDPNEVRAIIDYILSECDIRGIAYSEEDILGLKEYTLNLRPTADKVEESVVRVFMDRQDFDSRRSARFRRAIRAVIDADSVIDPREFDFITWLDEWAEGALTQ